MRLHSKWAGSGLLERERERDREDDEQREGKLYRDS